MTRTTRTTPFTLAILLTLALLAACAAPPTAPAAPAAQSASIATFPVTLKHKFGEVTIPSAPKRVLALGYSEVDPILALGVTPIAVRDWFGGQPYAVWPWSQPALGDAKPEVLRMPFGEINFEKLAALQPDLIVATHSGITAEEYEKLAQIAPTLAQTGDVPDFGMPWQAQTRLIGQALGKAKEADALVAEVEAAIAAARKDYPQLEGKTVAWASPASETGRFWAVGPTTPPMRFLASLGLRYPDELAGVVGDKDSEQISTERLDLLDADVLIFYASTPEAMAAVEQNAIFKTLKAVKDGRVIFFVGNDPIYGALSYSTAPSLRFAVEQLTPRLVAAVDKRDSASVAPATTSVQVLATTNEHRLVRDAMGEKKVPLAPKCIVVAGSGYLDHLLALGVTPCGAAHGPAGSGFPAYLAERLKDVAYVGGTLQVNLEAVAKLRPDLILAMHPAHTEGQFKTLLDPIATTVYLTEPWQDWRAAMLEIASILGKEDVAKARLAEFDQKLADGKAALANGLAGQKVMFLRVFPDKLRVYGTASPTGKILYEGLGLTPATLTSSDHAMEISLEQVPEIDADHIFLLDQTKDQMAALKSNPLWQGLTAVKNGHVYPVDVKIWVQGEGIFAYDTLIDDVLKALAR